MTVVVLEVGGTESRVRIDCPLLNDDRGALIAAQPGRVVVSSERIVQEGLDVVFSLEERNKI